MIKRLVVAAEPGFLLDNGTDRELVPAARSTRHERRCRLRPVHHRLILWITVSVPVREPLF